MLFEETFYTKDNKSFRVLCVDIPLAGDIKVCSYSLFLHSRSSCLFFLLVFWLYSLFFFLLLSVLLSTKRSTSSTADIRDDHPAFFSHSLLIHIFHFFCILCSFVSSYIILSSLSYLILFSFHFFFLSLAKELPVPCISLEEYLRPLAFAHLYIFFVHLIFCYSSYYHLFPPLIPTQKTSSTVNLPSTRSLKDIRNFLHSNPINSIVLSKVHEQIEELTRTYVLVKGFEEHAVGKAKALSEKALEDLGMWGW